MTRFAHARNAHRRLRSWTTKETTGGILLLGAAAIALLIGIEDDS